MKSKTSVGQPLHTGIGIIDSQHQTFFTILKRIQESNLNNNPKKVSEIIEELHLYTLYHFATEERIMEESGTPNLDTHKKIHQKFIDRIEEFRFMNLVEDEELVQQLTETAEEWLTVHILNTDKIDLSKK